MVFVFAVTEVPERSATYNLQGNIDAPEESTGFFRNNLTHLISSFMEDFLKLHLDLGIWDLSFFLLSRSYRNHPLFSFCRRVISCVPLLLFVQALDKENIRI